MDVKADFISNGLMPPEIQALGFKWETEANLTKLLGFFIGEDISFAMMVQHLAENLENRLKKATQPSLFGGSVKLPINLSPMCWDI